MTTPDPSRHIAAAAQHLQPGWDDVHLRAQAERLRARLVRRREQRRARTVGAVGLLVVAGLGALGALALRGGGEVAREGAGELPLASGSAAIALPRRMSFEDGSVAHLSTDAHLEPLVSPQPRELTVALRVGHARFTVARRASRTFRVTAGEVTVEVVGTTFSVERGHGGRAERVRVSVEQGRVRVTWPGGERHLGPTEAVVVGDDEGTRTPRPPTILPLAPAVPAPAEPEGPAVSSPPGPSPRPVHRAPAAPAGARSLARLAPAPAPVTDTVRELLLEADAARRAGRARDAVAPLRRLTSEFGRDPRAALAAFTLGRVLFDELHDAAGAADAFALVATLDPKSPLAEDALAREVDAARRAGAEARGRRRAEEYLRRYPRGTHAEAMRELARIPAPRAP
jgi:transmembrane sensor